MHTNEANFSLLQCSFILDLREDSDKLYKIFNSKAARNFSNCFVFDENIYVYGGVHSWEYVYRERERERERGERERERGEITTMKICMYRCVCVHGCMFMYTNAPPTYTHTHTENTDLYIYIYTCFYIYKKASAGTKGLHRQF